MSCSVSHLSFCLRRGSKLALERGVCAFKNTWGEQDCGCPSRETNMKVRQAIPITWELGDVSKLAKFDGE